MPKTGKVRSSKRKTQPKRTATVTATKATHSKASEKELKPSSPATVSSASIPEAAKKELSANFRESHRFIREQIVVGHLPEQELDITKQFRMSQIALDNYVTLDWQHYQEIQKLMGIIREYARDRSRRRPLNIIMQAEPGSGKSHFIKSLARKMSQEGISEVTFNMASFKGVEDFVQPLEAVRNLKVVDKLPLLFLDEFDSHPDNYAHLLSLLWDGELSVGHRELRIGKVVIILAGSGAQIGEVMKNSKGMQAASVAGVGKLTDLLSRINGGELAIPGLDEGTGERDRRVDKVCLTLSLLKQRFGRKLNVAPWPLLRFVSDTKFRYGVRSISHLIDLIPSKDAEIETLQVKDLQLPLGNVSALKASSLAYHLIAEDGPAAVVETWKELRSNEMPVRFEPRSSLLDVAGWLKAFTDSAFKATFLPA